MKAKQCQMMVLMVLICQAALFIQGTEPAVSNVQASQRTDGSMIVDITYDLAGAGPEGTGIIVEVSPDGGASWMRPDHITGSAGRDIMNGTNLEVAWEAGTDKPDEYWLNCLVKVTATDNMIILMLPGNVPIELNWIPADSFVMGSPEDEQDRSDYEGPQRTVNISYDFFLGKYTVTKAQWEAVMGTAPWEGQSYVLDHPDSPAVYVSWNDIREEGGFLDTLNDHLADTGQGYELRLLSEAEWEYAARAGTTTRFYWGDDSDHTEIDDYAWYGLWGTEQAYAHIVGQKIPNGWGLYDMSGNVREWCEDDYHWDYHGAPTDGSAWVDSPRGSYRVARGGSWCGHAGGCRSAYRSLSTPDGRLDNLGFRVIAVEK